MRLDILRLKECRERLGISKQEAARRAGISQPAYLRYESGDRSPSVQMIKELARVLHTSSAYLTGEAEENDPDLIEISRSEDSDLFRIVQEYSRMDQNRQKRLLAYINKLKE